MLLQWWFGADPCFSFVGLKYFCQFGLLLLYIRYEHCDPICRLDTFHQRGNQGDPDEIFARINAVRVPCEKAPGQNSDIIIAIKQAGELNIADGCSYPKIKGRVRHGYR